jgi:phage repressor protein C with HTH and peptisase S24 domain
MESIKDIRRRNMRKLADKFPSRAKFAEFLEKMPAYVNQIIGKNPTKEIGHNLARHIEISFDLPSGWMDADHSGETGLTQTPKANAVDLGHADVYEGIDPIGPNEVQVPFFSEVELAAGNGFTNIADITNHYIRFDLPTLNGAGVRSDKVACCKVSGDSMEPVLPDGATVAIDTSQQQIIDGRMYAINHGGMLRVKYLYRQPFGGVKIRSANPDYEDELLSGEQVHDIRIIGRVFWFSALV